MRAQDAFLLNLKFLMFEREISGAELGRKVGVSRAQISNILRGENDLTLNETFKKIALCFKVEESDLFDPKFKIKYYEKQNKKSSLEKP